MFPPSQGRSTRPATRRSNGRLARSQAYEVLRDDIVSLRLPPGARVSDAETAEQLGVSRTPVREAILQLADEGLIDVVPQAGTYVSRIVVGAVRDAQFIREALELAALRRALENIRPADADRIRSNIAEQRRAESDGDDDRFYALDQEFHRIIIELSGHPEVWRITHRTRAHMDRVRRLSLPDPSVISMLVDQHDHIATTLADGRGDEAETALRDHVRLVIAELPQLISRYPDYFEDTADARP
jgi:GntR family transcriptional regulator, rspAB operon transcriptional repressor